MPGRSLRLAVALNGYGLEHEERGSIRRDVLGWEELSGLARLAEELGYESIFAPEIAGWESFTLLTGMADATERIGLVSGVIPLAARTAQRLAMGTASLQEVSGGRFTLGVGSSATIADTRTALLELRKLVAEGRGSDWSGDPRPARILLAALGPRMTDLAGELADGVILNWATPERVARARSALARTEGFTVAVYVRACLSHVDEQGEGALRTAASRYAAMEPYRRQFEATDVNASDPGEVVAATCMQGSREEALRQIEEYREAGADVVVVYPVPAGEAVPSLTATMMAAAPA